MNFRKSNGELTQLKVLTKTIVHPSEEQKELMEELLFLKEQLLQANKKIQKLLLQLEL